MRKRLTLGAARFAAIVALAGLAACGLAGCGRKPAKAETEAAQKTRAKQQEERAKQLVAAGNEAYKIGDYRLAARRYAAAAVANKDDAAAYFGMGMALSRLGRDEEARKAYARSRELNRLHGVLNFPGTPAAAGPHSDSLPPGHP